MVDDPLPRQPCDALLAVYANYCEVGHNALEFLIDFGQFRPEADGVHVHSRIVTGPVQAKLFSRLIADAIARFEAEHGTIADLPDSDPLSALIGNAPEFERRAMRARAHPSVPTGAPAPPTSR
jgi:hypothetical protein